MSTISRERLLEIAGKFMLDGEILDIVPYGSGHINDTFRLTVRNQDTEKDYILQRMNGDIFKNREELMENIVRVTSFLKEKIVAQGGNPDRETLQIIPTRE
ncbi:MAG: mucin desulfatase, partial [Eubacterium sp.]|nr:mucin desulfatase [Eubacterium sp.]